MNMKGEWNELREAADGSSLMYMRTPIDAQLVQEELKVINPEALDCPGWYMGRVRTRLIRSDTGAKLWDSCDFLQQHLSHRKLTAAITVQRELDKRKGM